jgi:protein O-GlcNAc transferase
MPTNLLPKTIAAPKQKLIKLLKLLEKGNNREVINRGARLLKAFPHNQDALRIVARAHHRMGNTTQALSYLKRLVQDNPNCAQTWISIADAEKAAGELDRAEHSYKKAIELEPKSFAAHHNLGTLFLVRGELEHAVSSIKVATTLQPEQGMAFFNLANAYRGLGAFEQALGQVKVAHSCGYQTPETQYLEAATLHRLGRTEDAIAVLQQLLQASPDYTKARLNKLHWQAHLADWDWTTEYDIYRVELESCVSSPFAHLALEDNPEHQLHQSQKQSCEMWPNPKPPLAARPIPPAERIKVGYFSSDFHDHATLHLMRGMFHAHDTSEFHIYVYSYDTAPEDDARRGIRQAVEKFHDVEGLSDAQIAAQARSDGLDIAIDLKGHTEGSRLGIFAERAAPVQVTWLGYPGSTGAPFIDWLIADEMTVPKGADEHYSEQVYRMPDSYQINDDRREIAEKNYTRGELGLPDDGFVFCCFNATYKICPRVFSIWMQLLKSVNGSVLWLLSSSPAAEENLRTAAQDHGLCPDRLIFAPRWPQAEHLARQAQADLFLDTFTVNAHTTASDALWAGLPVVTRIGDQFAARVGASLLQACDLPELIAQSDDEYRAIAHSFAMDQAFQEKIKNQLGRKNTSLSLFDTPKFTRGFEKALLNFVSP